MASIVIDNPGWEVRTQEIVICVVAPADANFETLSQWQRDQRKLLSSLLSGGFSINQRDTVASPNGGVYCVYYLSLAGTAEFWENLKHNFEAQDNG